MSFLSMMEARLPPGFRFHPRDDELICDYLSKKISGELSGALFYGSCPMMIDVDLNKCEPWDLPNMACVGGKEWYFFSLRDRKYATGQRTNRATISGYWKATGKDRQVSRRGLIVGMRKTLVFYQGRAPKGRKTDWVMHEFRMETPCDQERFSSKEDWVLCRVFYKSRGLSSKPNKENSYEDTSSSSLPPLAETYITFGQTSMNMEGYEQVPCFSNPFPTSTVAMPPQKAGFPMPPPSTIPMIERNLPSDLQGSGFNQINQLHCDKKVIRTVLNHLTKIEAPSSLGEESIESYFCENGLSSIW